MSDKLPAKRNTADGLNARQRAFVQAMVLNGGNLTKSALAAGYSAKNASNAGQQVWRSNLVKDAYKAALIDKLARGAGIALNSLLDLAEDAESEHARILAAKEVLKGAKILDAPAQSGGAVTINIGLSDPNATKPIDITAHSVDMTELVEPKHGDQ